MAPATLPCPRALTDISTVAGRQVGGFVAASQWRESGIANVCIGSSLIRFEMARTPLLQRTQSVGQSVSALGSVKRECSRSKAAGL